MVAMDMVVAGVGVAVALEIRLLFGCSVAAVLATVAKWVWLWV